MVLFRSEYFFKTSINVFFFSVHGNKSKTKLFVDMIISEQLRFLTNALKGLHFQMSPNLYVNKKLEQKGSCYSFYSNLLIVNIPSEGAIQQFMVFYICARNKTGCLSLFLIPQA